MKPLKKFSAILENESSLLESLTKTYGAGILDLVKKLGYSNMDEIAKEKKLLTKLETLLKDIPKKQNISEDDAEEIEAEDIKRGEPKSVENMAGEKVTKDEGPSTADDLEEADIEFDDDEEEDEEVGAAGKAVPKEVGDGEKTSDEIEDDDLALGEPEHEPESKGDAKVSKDEPITAEVPAEEDDEDAGIDVEEEEERPKATRRIKAFEDFIKEDGDGSTSTVIKKVRYSDDATEPEDYGVPIAASADPLAEEFTYADAMDAAGRNARKEDKNLASELKKLGASSVSDLKMIASFPDETFDEKKWKPTGDMNLDSDIYDTVEIGTYDGKPAIVGNSDGDLFAYVKESLNEYQGGPLEGESDWTYGDSVETAGGQRSKEMKNIAPFLKQLGVKDLHKLAMIDDSTETWDNKKWKPSGKKITNSEVYDTVEIGTYDGKQAIVGNSDGDLFVFVKEGYDGEKRGADDEYKGDEDEDKGDKKVDKEDKEEKKKHYKGAEKSDKKEIAALTKDLDYDKEKEEESMDNKGTLILSFNNFIAEKYDKVVWGGDKDDKSKTHGGVDYPEDEEEKDEAYDEVTLGGNKGDKSKSDPGEEDYEDDDKKEEKFDDVTLGGNKGDKSKSDPGEEDYEDEDKKDEDCGADHEDEDKKEESVTEETDEMEAKAETIEDEDKAEETGAAGIAIPLMKGDGSESAAGIAAGTMERGKPKKEPESLGAGFVSKEEVIEEEPKDSPDEPDKFGKVVTSVPNSTVSENLTKKQEKLPEGLKRAILKKAGKSPTEIEEALSRMNEKEITSDDEFKEYATELLKKAHGDDYDEAKATEVIDGLKDKYKGDYGAMVGALQSSMG